jgi:Gas vesicle protein
MQTERYARSSTPTPAGGSDLADILERVLDKGIVVAGDISISLLDIELLTIKLRLLIASADTAKKMGIDWWENDPFLSGKARESLPSGNGSSGLELEERLDRIESALHALAPEASK